MGSAKLLGIAQGDTLIFDSENETSVLMDFALHEYRVNNQNAIEIYREKIGWRNEIEKDLLDALLSSYASLFKIISISESEQTLLLNQEFPLMTYESYVTMVADSSCSVSTNRLLLLKRLSRSEMTGCLVESNLTSPFRRSYPTMMG